MKYLTANSYREFYLYTIKFYSFVDVNKEEAKNGDKQGERRERERERGTRNNKFLQIMFIKTYHENKASLIVK